MENIVKGIGGEYTGNYTGPYWSNGKVQSSVEWGDEDPQSALDFLSRQHDSAYAKYKDAKHREAADLLYNEEAKKLAGKFPQLAGSLVLYGNKVVRSAEKTAGNYITGFKYGGVLGGLGGLIYTAAGNIRDANDMINGTYLLKERNDVKEYYKTDPYNKTPPASGSNFSEGGKPLPNSSVKTLTKGSVAPEVRGPTVHDVRKAELVASQAKRFENYQNLKHEADNSVYIPRMMGLARRPTGLQKAYRKRKNINKIKPL